MNIITHLLKYILISTFLASSLSICANATAVSGVHTMNFDNTPGNPTFLQLGPILHGPLDLTSSLTAPGVNASILQDGIRTATIGEGSLAPLDQAGDGHLHYAFNFTDLNTAVSFDADTGGAAIFADAGSFSFQSMFFASMNRDILVTGYNSSLAIIASTVISAASSATTIDFLALDSGFGNVTLIEMWQESTGRGNFGTSGASTKYDNIVIASPVPVPAALYLFATGLLGLGASKRYIQT